MPDPVSYAPQSIFWSAITSLMDLTLVTRELLYIQGLHRLADRSQWLLDEIGRRSFALQSTTAGTPGVLTGSIDLSTLTYDPSAGSLNGKTLQVQTNNNGPDVVTFGTGGSAPVDPEDVADQINTATSSNPLASLDAANHLNLSSVTTGGLGTVTVIDGTALTLLGLTATTGTGQTTGGDGSDAIGVSDITGFGLTLSAGSLKDVLQSIANNVFALMASGAVTDADQTVVINGPDQTLFLATPTANRVIALPTASQPTLPIGTRVRLVRPAAGAFTYTITRETNTGGNIVVMPSATWDFAYCELTAGNIWKLLGTKAGTPGADA